MALKSAILCTYALGVHGLGQHKPESCPALFERGLGLEFQCTRVGLVLFILTRLIDGAGLDPMEESPSSARLEINLQIKTSYQNQTHDISKGKPLSNHLRFHFENIEKAFFYVKL